jgi:hypothetical protein
MKEAPHCGRQAVDMETSNLHKGRMEDDEDGGTLMPSATGTLDRKTSQASPTTCFQPRELPTTTRSINNDKACRGHEEEDETKDEKDGRMRLRTAMTRTPRTPRTLTMAEDDLMMMMLGLKMKEAARWNLLEDYR